MALLLDTEAQPVRVGITLVLLVGCYWGVDLLLRRQGWRSLFLRPTNDNSFVLFSMTLLSALALLWPWPGGDWTPLRWFGTSLATLLAWNAATRDIDPTQPRAIWAQASVFPSALMSWWSPAFLLLTGLLLSVFLRFWLHHATFPLRLLQALIAGLTLTGASVFLPPGFALDVPAALLTFLLIIQISHYFITALAKGLLGPKWTSWITDNRLHFLAASAYSWGWGRFMPWRSWLTIVRTIQRVERPLQLSAFALESSAPLALLHPSLSVGYSLAFAGFHLGVFAVAGLLFWDWIAADLLLAGLVLSFHGAGLTLGLTSLLFGLVILALFPLRHRLWQPMPLGWFDTPLTARMHWRVIGQSGKEYGLYNNFMCPHERLYGRVNGCFFAPHPVVTYHLGEVWKPDLRAAIEAAGPSPSRLAPLRQRYGILPQSAELRARHVAYLKQFFCALNAGAKKSLLPPRLRWMKAPGDQLFYWGSFTPYERQEVVKEVRIRFVEEYFDGERLVRLNDQEVCRFSVPEEREACSPELSPKELDDYLLGLAEGRLIDLPGMKKNYTAVLSENEIASGR